MPPAYLQRLYDLPAVLEDDFSVALWLVGTLGVHSVETAGRVRLEAWFEPGAEEVEDGEGWRARGVVFLGEETAPSLDWLAAFRASASPFPVGERFFVDPREPDGEPGEAPEGRVLLRLPARTAFGTGSHESTALALELLEDVAPFPRPFAVLDVGTGTGILAFAAHLLADASRPCSTVALDLDPAAVFAARDNARLNAGILGEANPRLFAGTVEALDRRAHFDLVLINVIPEEIAAVLPRVVSHLAPGGELIFSGILAARGSDIVSELARLGCSMVAARRAGEWVGYRFRAGS